MICSFLGEFLALLECFCAHLSPVCVCSWMNLHESSPRGDAFSKAAQPGLISHQEQSWEFLWNVCSCKMDFLHSIHGIVVHAEPCPGPGEEQSPH